MIIVRIMCDLPEKVQVEVVIVKTFVGARTIVLLSLCVGGHIFGGQAVCSWSTQEPRIRARQAKDGEDSLFYCLNLLALHAAAAWRGTRLARCLALVHRGQLNHPTGPGAVRKLHAVAMFLRFCRLD